MFVNINIYTAVTRSPRGDLHGKAQMTRGQ